MSGERHPRVWTTAEAGRYVGDGHPDAVLLAAGVAGTLPTDFDPATFEATVEAWPTDEVELDEVEADEVEADEVDEVEADEVEADVEKPARGNRRK